MRKLVRYIAFSEVNHLDFERRSTAGLDCSRTAPCFIGPAHPAFGYQTQPIINSKKKDWLFIKLLDGLLIKHLMECNFRSFLAVFRYSRPHFPQSTSYGGHFRTRYSCQSHSWSQSCRFQSLSLDCYWRQSYSLLYCQFFSIFVYFLYKLLMLPHSATLL